ncbi:MAG: sugar transferase [Candidatus Tantalella remota]|nr:sugar transferase [Candidatus Tantalella remota]
MFKRVFDVFVAFIGLVVFSPVLIATGMVIKKQSPGPVFYRGIRTGLDGNFFRIFKFRTMVVDAENLGGPSTALNDPRLIRIGKFLRKYKLDELPQLFNVIRGEMSIVGPRPQVEKYTKRYNDEEKVILTVRPGLTDYASIKFIDLDKILGDGPVDEKYLKEIEPEKNRLRIKYAEEHSMFLDMKIIFLTIISLFRIRSLWNTKSWE